MKKLLDNPEVRKFMFYAGLIVFSAFVFCFFVPFIKDLPGNVSYYYREISEDVDELLHIPKQKNPLADIGGKILTQKEFESL